MALIAWLAEEDAMMALGRNMQALAARDCFQQSPDGVAWRAANDMLHLPGQRMSTHMDDVYCLSDMCRTYENCPESPVSLKVEVMQRTSAEVEPDPPVVLWVLGIKDNRTDRDGPVYQTTYDICPSLERTQFVRNKRRIALRVALFCLTDEEGLQLAF